MSNDNTPVPNEALREHVSDHSFVLALRKTHICMLIAVAHNQRRRDTIRDWISPGRGLKARGLLLHCTDVFGAKSNKTFAKTKPDPNGEYGWNDYYRLTKAGWAVFDLLIEAGLTVEVQVKRRLVA